MAIFSKTNIQKTIQIIIILFCFFSGFIFLEQNFLYPDELNRIEIVKQLISADDYSIFILGNSHARSAFNPIIMDETSNEKVVNLSMPNASLYSVYFYLKKAIIEGQEPDIVIFEAFILHEIYRGDALRIMDYTVGSTIYDILKYFPASVHNSAVSRFTSLDWTKIMVNGYRNSSGFQNSKNYEIELKGFVHSEQVLPIEEFAEAYQIGAYPIVWQDNYNRLFEAFVDLCKKNEIDLIAVRAPTVNTIGMRDQYSEAFFDKHGILFVDLNEDIVIHPENLYKTFYDAELGKNGYVNSHTNSTGAIYSSLKLLDILENLGYVEINQDIYQFYLDEFNSIIY